MIRYALRKHVKDSGDQYFEVIRLESILPYGILEVTTEATFLEYESARLHIKQRLSSR